MNNIIRNSDGEIISKTTNLRAIHRYAGKNLAKLVEIVRKADNGISQREGLLTIRFENDSLFSCEFASYEVLKYHLRCWRNLYGTRLYIGGVGYGLIGYKNPYLS